MRQSGGHIHRCSEYYRAWTLCSACPPWSGLKIVASASAVMYRGSAHALLLRVVRSAGHAHVRMTRVAGKIGEQQAGQQVVVQMVDRERRLIAFFGPCGSGDVLQCRHCIRHRLSEGIDPFGMPRRKARIDASHRSNGRTFTLPLASRTRRAACSPLLHVPARDNHQGAARPLPGLTHLETQAGVAACDDKCFCERHACGMLP